MARIEYGKFEEECGGGGAGPAGRAKGREGSGRQQDSGGAERERTKGGVGAVDEGEKDQIETLNIRERLRILAV